MQKSNKVIFNTMILYGKMIITVFVSLYATRIVLNALGVKDYGIYNLIAGVITMLSFLQVSMSASTQRFLSFHKGVDDATALGGIFSSSVILHFVISIVIVLGLELLGLPFLNHSLNLPADRAAVAEVVFHLMVLSTFLTINSVPYEGALNANEDMVFISLLSILEVVLKLISAISLFYISMDKLVFYTGSIVGITLLCRMISVYYCRSRYVECRAGLRSSNLKDIKSMLAFAGWNSFGALCAVGRNQGIAVVLNMFFGVVVNASYGIANQVSTQLSYFSQSMLMALRPQIVKSEGEGNREKMLRLSVIASKFSVYFMAICAVPFFIEMPFVLKLWLKVVPADTVVFCRLVIILNIIVQMSAGLMIAIQSAGNIKYYQAVVGTCVLLSLPFGYLFFKLGYPSYTILVVAIIIELLCTLVRVAFARRLVGLSIPNFAFEIFVKAMVPVLLAMGGVLYLHTLIDNEIWRFFAVTSASLALMPLLIYYIGLNAFERDIIVGFSQNAYSKFINRKK